MSDQSRTPLLDALRSRAERSHAAFYLPGHKQGCGSSPALRALLGKLALQADLPELPEFGNLFPPDGPIQDAQELAAAAFGADRTWFSVNGSTAGVIAAIAAVCGPDDKLVLPRNAHRCALAGLMLSGAHPIFVMPERDRTRDFLLPVTPEAIGAALDAHPDARAVLVVSPTYRGASADLKAIASLTHARDLPLVVDEAHGAHFGFHPAFPSPALAAGADAAVQSWHKTLGALVQAAAVHVRGTRIDRDRLSNALQMVHSSSPSHLLLASLDAARQQIAVGGRDLLDGALHLAAEARVRLQSVPGVLLAESVDPCDPLRLTVDLTGVGLSGYEADELLHADFDVTAELPTLQALTFVVTFGNAIADIDRLGGALQALARTPRSARTFPHLPLPPGAVAMRSPRVAFFTPSERVFSGEAIGRASAESICLYPPGIPVLIPGEAISAESLNYLKSARALGHSVAIDGCSDPSLETLRVLRD
ncbi:arginine/lysine/ornithine decarboxylase [Rubidibacter lacunae KORDI 51-2]|uniref:Arginine/lysine/ornithine decarboxylase n=1 Tax=Rubidibacter lacunae KORDI 51-2 TaxID=582515 RepID=U5DHJ9_9CHRO|nr:aminotransferase class I/II-fold pyridoxal phosphate-dependent enzyme [Rubidibacter lacunae]ERN40064.1 arginine/lysine/ornithine decarboxylase [Rubidibacter lacunae KORDI 51-2]